MKTGFSTGSLAKGDFEKGIELLLETKAECIEISALRANELPILAKAVNELSLNKFEYISIHAPGKIEGYSEKEMAEYLVAFADKGWPIVIHPDMIEDYEVWKDFGSLVCVENMDKRKNTARTFHELSEVFSKLPEAMFCLDLGHSKQIDPTMFETKRMIREFSNKLLQLHVSNVNSDSKHEPLDLTALIAFKTVAALLPDNVPVILESPLDNPTVSRINFEMELAKYALSGHSDDEPDYYFDKFIQDIPKETALDD